MNNIKTISEELRKEKQDLQRAVSDLIYDFEKRSSLKISDVRLIRSSPNDTLIGVKIIVEL